MFINKFKEKIKEQSKDLPEEYFEGDKLIFQGFSWCILISNWNNNLIDLKTLDKKDDKSNFELVFKLIEENIGVPNFLEVEDFLNKKEKPDYTCVLTYGVVVMENGKKLKRSNRGSIIKRKSKSNASTLREGINKKTVFSRQKSSSSIKSVQISPSVLAKEENHNNKEKEKDVPTFLNRETSTKLLVSKIDEVFSQKEDFQVSSDWGPEEVYATGFSRKLFDALIEKVKTNTSDLQVQKEILNDILLMKNAIQNSVKRLKQLGKKKKKLLLDFNWFFFSYQEN